MARESRPQEMMSNQLFNEERPYRNPITKSRIKFKETRIAITIDLFNIAVIFYCKGTMFLVG
jgi:hypothetical protein